MTRSHPTGTADPRPTGGTGPRPALAAWSSALALLIALTGCSGDRERATWRDGAPTGTGTQAAAPASGTPAGTSPSAGPTGPAPRPSPKSSATSRPGPGPTTARVVLTRSGGIAGQGDTITVESRGAWTVTDRAGKRRTGTLGIAERTRLQQLTNDPRLATEALQAPAGTSCRDVFTYTLSAGAYRVTFTDCPTDSDRPAAALAIVDLLTTATN